MISFNKHYTKKSYKKEGFSYQKTKNKKEGFSHQKRKRKKEGFKATSWLNHWEMHMIQTSPSSTKLLSKVDLQQEDSGWTKDAANGYVNKQLHILYYI